MHQILTYSEIEEQRELAFYNSRSGLTEKQVEALLRTARVFQLPSPEVYEVRDRKEIHVGGLYWNPIDPLTLHWESLYGEFLAQGGKVETESTIPPVGMPYTVVRATYSTHNHEHEIQVAGDLRTSISLAIIRIALKIHGSNQTEETT